MSGIVQNQKYRNRQKIKDAFISLFIGIFAVIWMVPMALVTGTVAMLALAFGSAPLGTMADAVRIAALFGTAGLAIGLSLAALGWWWPGPEAPPKLPTMAAYFVSGTVAGLVAWKRALWGEGAPVWEPTPRALNG